MSKTTLSTGVELGCWAIPAKNGVLPPIEMTTEEIQQYLEQHPDELAQAIAAIEVGVPLHQRLRPGEEVTCETK